jgi:trehalose 6-phosphate synthase
MADDAAAPSPVVIVSNRGPLSFRVSDDGVVARRGAGGLVSGLAPLVAGTDTTWVAAAMSEGDRDAARRGLVDAEGFRVRMVDVDPTTYRMAYDVVCNATLWFVHHHLFDLARRPRFDHRFREAWDAYIEVNRAFADVLEAETPEGAAVLIQDYHLTLVARSLAGRRPDLRTVHFSHTPFAGPDALRVLPDDVAAEMLRGLVAHDACGFHTSRWADAFSRSCSEVIGERPRTFVAPLASDLDDLRNVAGSDAAAAGRAGIAELVGDRKLIVRVDRIELSKNLLRGFHAFDELLERRPEWRGQVVFGAFVYPSREGLPEYLAYRQEVETLVDRINARWQARSQDRAWTPIVLDTSDDFPRSVAALQLYDVLLVNPIRDGLNLVAKEGPSLNERDGVVVLSPDAGVWSELHDHVIGANPFDVTATADALDAALRLDGEERKRRAAGLREAAAARTPADWLDDQLAAARGH